MPPVDDALRSADYDVVIVGAGMVGISLALMLAQQAAGWRILLLEARCAAASDSDGHFDARSTALSSSTQRIFQNLDLWQQVQRHTSAIQCIHVSDRGYPGITRITAADADVEALGYVVENDPLNELLERQLACVNIAIRRSSEVSVINVRAGGVELGLTDVGHSLSSKLLIVADGTNSKTAQKLGFYTDNHDHKQAAIVANIGLDKAHNGVAYERFTALGPIALLPLTAYRGRPRAALVWSQPSDGAATTMALEDTQFLSTLQSQFGYRLGIFRKIGARASFPLITSLADEQVRRGIALLGNAAHSLHPVAGQGFNLALRDASSLAAIIGRARAAGLDFASTEVLDQYRQAQSADQRRVVALTRGLPAIFASRSPVAIAGRNAALLSMDVMRPLRHRFADFGMGHLGGHPDS